ncbi:MAG: citrate lyase holo-[Clostridia bacterium]|nr:citrate lyase holo-[acyl-carrier protein] synthase [Clostridia bacterium]
MMEEIRRVCVEDMLRARDARAERQQKLLAAHHTPLISFTMNIAGDVKYDRQIRRAFDEGVRRILRRAEHMDFPVLDRITTINFTGCEAIFSVHADARLLKEQMYLIEEADALGRLFDIDVLDESGNHLSRGTERACLICGAPARACARSRAHDAPELYRKAHAIIEEHFREEYVRFIGETAQRALLYEALTTPKPGLVDCLDNGAHSDMNLFSFADSACALRPYFEVCARMGAENAALPRLQYAGQLAEDAMYAAAGVNTHKGAIFALGILCYAAGSCQEFSGVDAIFEKSASVGSFFLGQMKASPHVQTGGEIQYRQFGLTGARGEAASGFASVKTVALPALKSALNKGKPLHEAGLYALISLMRHVKDSNIIRRAGIDAQEYVFQQAQLALDEGLSESVLREMNQSFIRRNISPGGCADLLAAAYFLYFLESRHA